MTRIRCAIAEDNALLARSIQQKLDLFPRDLEVVFSARNGRELLDRLDAGERVDVVLMDIEMPVMDGIEATRLVTEKHPQIAILMQTVFDDEQRIYDAILAGAKGYLMKEEPPHRYLEAIRAVKSGGASLSENVAAKSLDILRHPEVVEKPEPVDYHLSRRELEVLQQLQHGLNYKEIADNLSISPATVRKHLENLYRKLHVRNKMEAVQVARREHLI